MAQTAQNKEDSDILEKLVEVYRVSKVVKGGRRFSFSAVVVAGDGKGNVGYGHGKAKEVGEARAKATNEAKKNLKRVALREGRTLHHDVVGKFGSAKVVLRSAPPGTGIIAGGPMRAVFECLGVQDVVGKSLGSSNSHNLIKATFDALFNNATSPRDMANKRGKKVSYIIERRELSKKDTGSGEANDVKETNESE